MIRPFMDSSPDPRAVAAQEAVRKVLPHAVVQVRDSDLTDGVTYQLGMKFTSSMNLSKEDIIAAGDTFVEQALSDMVSELQRFAPKELGLPAVETTEVWISYELADAATGLGLRTGIPTQLLYDQRDDGSAVVPADQLRALLKMAGYEFRKNMPRGG